MVGAIHHQRRHQSVVGARIQTHEPDRDRRLEFRYNVPAKSAQGRRRGQTLERKQFVRPLRQAARVGLRAP